ncbi:MAG: transcription initiation factor IIB, partial [Methanomicrobium sp.]|nr:transcription initiation factor IIB [Methanomicrobium sp.]
MQEIEKLKQLQSQREALRKRSVEQVEKQQKKPEEKTKTVCPECGSRQLVHDYERAELICQNCGLVLEEEF